MNKAVVIGVSTGGLNALKAIIPQLPASFPFPVIIVQHLGSRSDTFLADYLNDLSQIKVKEAEDKEPICQGYVYIAPAGYHLLVEPDYTFSLSADERVNYSRPSIDVLFESAVDVFERNIIGIILTGANSDGAAGLKKIHESGGISIIQNPKTAEAGYMPEAAAAMLKADYIVDLEQIASLLVNLGLEMHGEEYANSNK